MKRRYLRNYFEAGKLEAGCDEAGRGCLAGPVYAAAVILPAGYKHRLLNDSKKISPENREILRLHIEKNAVAWAVGWADPLEIDEQNILQASFTAMHRAISKLPTIPSSLLIDGNRFRDYPGIPHSCHIGGDGRYKSIAAASVLAKTYRDKYMHELAQSFPHYDWTGNVGYGTPAHLQGIRDHGLCPHHRRSFTKAFYNDPG